MADIKSMLSEGDLAGALDAAKDQVRDKPSELAPRVLLFQLFCVAGDWKRAMTQLNVAADLDPMALPMAQTYRQGLNAEAFRAEVFAGKRSPLVLGEPPEWIGAMFESLRLLADGKTEPALAMRARALEGAPAVPGSVNGQPFEWIMDADQRFGPALECVVNGKYYWVPFERIKRVSIEPPADLRDMVWTAAQFTWANDGQAVGLIPTRYPGSPDSPDPMVRLARK
ncbi:MAG: type VI secretion system accessory protein TagJ, partial [Phycisphaerales bacterium JB040]